MTKRIVTYWDNGTNTGTVLGSSEVPGKGLSSSVPPPIQYV